jgi:ABC-2 type transport system permease protein
MLPALMKKELLALSRDLHGLAALFLMPMLFIVIMSLALKDVYDPPLATLAYAVEDRDGSELSRILAREWQQRHGKPQVADGDWREPVRNGQVGYAVVIEAGFAEALVAPRVDEAVRLRLVADPAIDGGAFAAYRAELLMLATELRGQVLLAASAANPGTATASLSAQPLIATERLANGTRPSAVQQNVPAWLIFGMFFVVASIAGLFVEERQCGALARLAAFGVSKRAMMLSKAIPYLGINAVQAALMLAVGVWLVPLLGGDALSLAGIHWGALLLVLAAVSTAAIGMALALASVVRTHAQAAAVGPIVNVVLAAVGGVMVPTFVMPEFMQRVAALSPMNWGLEGALAVLLRGGALADVALPAAKLAVFGVVMGVVAALVFRRQGAR